MRATKSGLPPAKMRKGDPGALRGLRVAHPVVPRFWGHHGSGDTILNSLTWAVPKRSRDTS